MMTKKTKNNSMGFQILLSITLLLVIGGVALLADQYYKFGYWFEVSDILHHEQLIVIAIVWVTSMVLTLFLVGSLKLRRKR